MKTPFTKMHGLGNDFVVFNAVRQPLSLSKEQVRYIADRKLGIGCDQVLLVEAALNDEADFRYRIYNADGNEVENCGNGARCLYRFVHEQGLSDKPVIKVRTMNSIMPLSAAGTDGQVRVDMGEPAFEPSKIPFDAHEIQPRYRLELGSSEQEIGAVSIGNPHAVIKVDNIDTADVNRLGPQVEHHTRFPQRANVGFMQIVNPHSIRLRVFERGVGETMACGTGACAAVAVGCVQGILDKRVEVELTGGRLLIEWEGKGEPLMMTGPSETVYEGFIQL